MVSDKHTKAETAYEETPGELMVRRLVELHQSHAQGMPWHNQREERDELEGELLALGPQDHRDFIAASFTGIAQADTPRAINPYICLAIERLLIKKLPLLDDDLVNLMRWCENFGPLGYVLKAVERYAKDHELSDELKECLRRASPKNYFGRSSASAAKMEQRILVLLGEEPEQPQLGLNEAQPWAMQLVSDLEQIAEPYMRPVHELVLHARMADGSKPKKKWAADAERMIAVLPADFVTSLLTSCFDAFDRPASQAFRHWPSSEWAVPEVNADMMRGLIWLTTWLPDDELIRAVAKTGISGQRKIPGFGPRCGKVTNAAIWALGQIDRPLAVGQLAILKSRITNKATLKQIEKAMNSVAERLDMPKEEVEEMSVPTYGLTDVGLRHEAMGEFTAELEIVETGKTELRWWKGTPGKGKAQKSVPAAVKGDCAEELKQLKAEAKDIQKMLPAQRDRLDLLHLKQKSWSYAVWAERYLNHPLVGTLARRIVWSFDHGETKGKIHAVWLDGRLVDSSGEAVQIDSDAAIVSIWHPVGKEQAEILAWREFFETREIKQPFKQAHRELYLLTDAERNTNVYSNRYAAHIIKQHQFNALCGVRGWKNSLRLMVDDSYEPATLELPEWGLRAEFWVDGAGDEYGVDTNETGTYLYLATDQVRFYRAESARNSSWGFGESYVMNAGGAGLDNINEPVPLAEIPPLVLSEVLRDVDLFLGVASVGNDPQWQDGGPEGRYRDYWHSYSFGNLSGTATTRKQMLERLVPRLKIADRCSFSDKFLVVKGNKRTYKIHLGSGNILMEPNDQYLCIVPGRGSVKGPAGKVFLPFEGDRTLSIILSKAFMLAEDAKITDRTILSQIGG